MNWWYNFRKSHGVRKTAIALTLATGLLGCARYIEMRMPDYDASMHDDPIVRLVESQKNNLNSMLEISTQVLREEDPSPDKLAQVSDFVSNICKATAKTLGEKQRMEQALREHKISQKEIEEVALFRQGFVLLDKELHKRLYEQA